MLDIKEHVTTVDARTHYVYRLFNTKGNLLYVGMTVNLETRFKDHSRKSWWHMVKTKTIETLPTRADAFYVEAIAILRESPKYNKDIPSIERLEVLESRATVTNGGITQEDRIILLETRVKMLESEARANNSLKNELAQKNHQVAILIRENGER